MESKTLNNQIGYSLVSILVGMALALMILGGAILTISPAEVRQRARDEKRLADLSSLESAINEFKIDYDRYPDASDILRQSHILPDDNDGPLVNPSGSGWIDANFSAYTNKLPLDPTNDVTYHYSYQHNGYTYELNAVLEYYHQYSVEDGGNNADVYEVGDNLTIL